MKQLKHYRSNCGLETDFLLTFIHFYIMIVSFSMRGGERMYNSKYSSVGLIDVINLLITYMDADNAKRMVADLSPGKSYMSSCDKAYELYEKAMNGNLQKPLIW